MNQVTPSSVGAGNPPSMPDLPAIFLGLPAGTRDDRVLLGVAAAGVLAREQVLGALKDRLQRVSHHSLAATPEAAELRMMLHAGVARLLLSSGVRPSQEAPFGLAPVERASTPTSSATSAWSAASGGVGTAASARSTADLMREFDELATLTLAKHGGWNPQAAQEVSMLASAMGVPQDRVPSILTNLATLGSPASRAVLNAPGRYPTQATAALREAAASNVHAPRMEDPNSTRVMREARVRAAMDEFEVYRAHEDPARRLVRNGMIGAAVGLLFLIVAALGLRIMFAGKGWGSGTGSGSGSGTGVAGANSPDASTAPIAPMPTPTPPTTYAGGTRTNPLLGANTSPATKDGGPSDFRAGEVVAQLREAAGAVQEQPARSGAKLVLALEAMGQGWPTATASDVVAAGDATAEFAYRAGSVLGPGREEALEPLVQSLESGLTLMADGSGVWTRERIRRASFACGVTARLLGERDLPSALRVRLRRQLATALGGALPTDQATVRQSVGAALDRMSGLMVGKGGPTTTGQPAGEAGGQLAGATLIASQQAIDAAWLSWAQCAKALLAENSPEEYTQLLLLALDRSMTSGKEPSLDPMIAGAIDQLTRQLPMDADGPARTAVLRWMTQADVSSVDLHVLTSALVQRADSGLELTATLSASATPTDRELLRDRYANLWQINESGTQETLAGRWVEAARGMLGSVSGSVPQGSFKERLAFAVQLSTLNTSAVEVMRGDWSSASLTLERARSPISRWDAGGGIQLGQGSSSWGELYVGAGNDIPKRLEILQAVRGPVSAMEARILVEEAMRAGNPEVRRDARVLLQRALDQPDVLKALLDFQPFIPATRDNGKLLEAASAATLPVPRAAQWRVEVRRGLLRRLLEVLAPDDGLYVDVAADSLLTDYRARITPPAAPAPPGEDDAMGTEGQVQERTIPQQRLGALPQLRSVPAELLATARSYQARLATQAHRGWFADPAFVSVQDAMRVRDGRLEACETDLQRFVVEQNAIIELQARTVAMDNRAAKDQAVMVLEAWRRDASGALHVFDQMAAGELAQARLWMLRFGGQLVGDGQPGGLLISPASAPTTAPGGGGAGS